MSKSSYQSTTVPVARTAANACTSIQAAIWILRSHSVAQTLDASLSPRRTGFFLLPVYVRHVVGEVVLWEDFLRILRFSLSVLFHP